MSTRKLVKLLIKFSLKTKKVDTLMTYEDCYKMFFAFKKAYTSHKYPAYNNIYPRLKILSSTVEYDPIYHMDYSENLSQRYKNSRLAISKSLNILYIVLLNMWLMS